MIRTPLKRKTRLRPRREKQRKKAGKIPDRAGRARRVTDRAYLDHIRRQPCLMPACPMKRSEAHHYGRRGLGQKCGDDKVAPLCGTHHRPWWHDKGHLPGMTPEESRELIRREGERLRANWERERK